MRWEHYGQQTSFGWEVDHIRAVANGGSDDLDNLQPLQWENNRKKGDSR
jgi:5-methylcytosine-specific restriction endonuclease McrA